ncbi:metallophosphoesterase 1-like isoform X2 [Varroa jacobsoni]|uniref:metallophosphoesterase 1-like isoform X2 n=1 Tax=Varroa jacobsoni TaxID=62625 RepID=UPI000BF79F4A|nr:metallophosphoesterase 1-like isoform X2 [Varroa jacobsoni]
MARKKRRACNRRLIECIGRLSRSMRGDSGAAVMVLQTSDVDNVKNEDSQATPTIRARTLSLRGLQGASDADRDFRFAIESDRAGPQSTSRLSLRRFQRTLHHMSLPPALLMDIQGSFWRRYVPKILLSLACIIIYCEVVIYYLVLLQCTWPLLDSATQEHNIRSDPNAAPLKVMMVADTHLLGPFRGHWFDKLRREWQMKRTFATAMTLHQPEVVVFLGDLFDEGQWMDNVQFNRDVQRFKRIFPQAEKTKFIVAAGNHDVGFHYKMTKVLVDRFQRLFSESDSGVELITVKGSAFVSLNSIALEGDHCAICTEAEKELNRIEQIFNCSRTVHERRPVDRSCEALMAQLPHYTRPILLQHFPLYRANDRGCQDRDGGPNSDGNRERWEVLSKDMTARLLKLNPRAVFDGHSHHSCSIEHNGPQGPVPEWTLPSFNWRNKNNPAFVLSVFTPSNFAVSQCRMPQESTVMASYCVCLLALCIWLAVRRCRRNRYQGFIKLPMQRS